MFTDETYAVPFKRYELKKHTAPCLIPRKSCEAK